MYLNVLNKILLYEIQNTLHIYLRLTMDSLHFIYLFQTVSISFKLGGIPLIFVSLFRQRAIFESVNFMKK